uniref:Uncharacterized protein n=1 Tax=Aegilops tauschii subsp. strangulata TaxID=200361 RepID=A0A453P534_AEGTS
MNSSLSRKNINLFPGKQAKAQTFFVSEKNKFFLGKEAKAQTEKQQGKGRERNTDPPLHLTPERRGEKRREEEKRKDPIRRIEAQPPSRRLVSPYPFPPFHTLLPHPFPRSPSLV